MFGALVGAWGLAILAALPVYFPGERRDAVATGMSLVDAGPAWENVAESRIMLVVAATRLGFLVILRPPSRDRESHDLIARKLTGDTKCLPEIGMSVSENTDDVAHRGEVRNYREL